MGAGHPSGVIFKDEESEAQMGRKTQSSIPHLMYHPAPPLTKAGPRASPDSRKETKMHMHRRHEFSQFQ